MKIGMRNIKTALSVFICVVIARFLNLEYPFYAMIAAIISMQNTVNSSLKVGKNRVLGTFVGAAVGLICSLIMPGNAILCFCGVVVIIYLCNLLKWKESISIAGVVFCAIMVNMKGTSPYVYSVNRIFDTCLGILVALLVNYLIYPPQQFNTMYNDYINIKNNILYTFKLKILESKNYDIKKLNKDIEKVEKEIKMYKEEFSLKRKNHNEINNLVHNIEVLKEVILHMEILNAFEAPFILSDKNKKTFIKLCDEELEYEVILDDKYSICNYHINEILLRLDRIINDDKNLGAFNDISEEKSTTSISVN